MRFNGLKLQDEIASRRLTITDFAKKSQVPAGAIYRAIGGGNLRLSTAGKIASALNVKPSELCTRAPIKEASLE